MTPISLGKIIVPTPGTPVSITINSAAVVGYNPGTGPIAIVASVNDKVKVTVDGGSAQTLTLIAGTWPKDEIVSQLNAQVSGATFSLTARGNFMIASDTHTASSSLVLGSIANDAYAVLGLAVGSYNSMPDITGCRLVLRPIPGNAGSVSIGNNRNFRLSTGVGLLDVLIKDDSGYVDRFVAESESQNGIHTAHFFIDAANANDGVIGLLYVN